MLFYTILISYFIAINFDGLTGIRLCGEWGALKSYGKDKLCCQGEIVDIYDGDRKRNCCNNKVYYVDLQECKDGKLLPFEQTMKNLSQLTQQRLKNEIKSDQDIRRRTKPKGAKGAGFCGKRMKHYDQKIEFCCNKKLLPIEDARGSRRLCCHNKVYYLDLQECKDGTLRPLEQTMKNLRQLSTQQRRKHKSKSDQDIHRRTKPK